MEQGAGHPQDFASSKYIMMLTIAKQPAQSDQLECTTQTWNHFHEIKPNLS